MISKFLNAKHWQIFLLVFGLPFIVQMILMIVIAVRAGQADPAVILVYMRVFPFLMLLLAAVFFSWFWAVGVGLQKVLPSHIRLGTGRFKAFIFFPVIYILLMLIGLNYFISGHSPDPAIFMVIVPLHLFSMFCIFYCLYFVAKTFKTAELQREVTFSDFAGEFFLIWFFPIGIWIVQPKINRIVMERGFEETKIGN